MPRTTAGVTEWTMGGREGTAAEAHALAMRFDMPGGIDDEGKVHLRVTPEEQWMIIRALYDYGNARS